MGMYTEINMRANLRNDTPEEVLQVLEAIVHEFGPRPETLPDHPFFESHRWDQLTGTSAYFPEAGRSEVVRGDSGRAWDLHRVAIRGSLKNYDNEIDEFFDWIDPYIDAEPGEFLGYSLYEEDQYADGPGPALRVKGGVVAA